MSARETLIADVSDYDLLVRVAKESSRFRSRVIRGDTDWVYEQVKTEGGESSRELVELLVECLRRGLIPE